MFGTTGGKAASHDTRSVTARVAPLGFTVIELLVIITIIGCLMALLSAGLSEAPGKRPDAASVPATCGRSDWLPSIFIPHSPAFRPAARATPPRRPRGDSLFLCFPSSTIISFSRNSTLRCRSPTPPTPFCPVAPLPFLRCPSDLNLLDESSDYSGFAGWTRNNYRGNGGNDTGALDANGNETNNGIFCTNRRVSIDQISDGVDATALFSEGVTGDGDNGVISTPGDWFVVSPPDEQPHGRPRSSPSTFTPLSKGDAEHRIEQPECPAGASFIFGNYFDSRYNHLMSAQRPQRRHCRWEGDPFTAVNTAPRPPPPPAIISAASTSSWRYGSVRFIRTP